MPPTLSRNGGARSSYLASPAKTTLVYRLAQARSSYLASPAKTTLVYIDILVDRIKVYVLNA